MKDFVAQGSVLPVHIHISDALSEKRLGEGKPIPAPLSGVAMIDTGATFSCVCEPLVLKLGIKATRQENRADAAGVSLHNLYPVKLVLPGNISFSLGDLAGVKIDQEIVLGKTPYVALIGRDILSKCVFELNGPEQKFLLKVIGQ